MSRLAQPIKTQATLKATSTAVPPAQPLPSIKQQVTVAGYYKNIAIGSVKSFYRVYQSMKLNSSLIKQRRAPTWSDFKEKRVAQKDLRLTAQYLGLTAGLSSLFGLKALLALGVYPFVWRFSSFSPLVTPSFAIPDASLFSSSKTYRYEGDLNQKKTSLAAQALIKEVSLIMDEIATTSPAEAQIVEKWKLFENILQQWTLKSGQSTGDKSEALLLCDDLQLIMRISGQVGPLVVRNFSNNPTRAQTMRHFLHLFKIRHPVPVTDGIHVLKSIAQYRLLRKVEALNLTDSYLYDRNATIDIDDALEVLNRHMAIPRRFLDPASSKKQQPQTENAIIPESSYSTLVNSYVFFSQNLTENVRDLTSQLPVMALMRALVAIRTNTLNK